MKFDIKNELFSLKGKLKAYKEYKFGKKWSYAFNLEMNETKKDFQIHLTRENIDILAVSIEKVLRKLKNNDR